MFERVDVHILDRRYTLIFSMLIPCSIFYHSIFVPPGWLIDVMVAMLPFFTGIIAALLNESLSNPP